MARKRGIEDWKTIVQSELKQEPAKLPKPYKVAAQALYEDFHTILVQGQDSHRFQESVARL
jgi:hypothetical protein